MRVADCFAMRDACFDLKIGEPHGMTIDDIDFLIIGAAKSATTAMQRALQKDPSIYMPDPELHYFSREFHRGHAWYLSQFANGAGDRVVGEKSNSYLDTPEAAARIHVSLPNARLIAQLRNPIERAYSDYCMLYRRAEVDSDIDSHLDPRKAAGGRFLRGGLYHEQLARFYDLFPSNNLMVVLYEDFRQDASAQLSDVRRFIGLSADFDHDSGQKKVKDKTSPMLSPEVRRRLRWLQPVIAPLRRYAAFKALRRMMVREIRYSPLSPEIRDRLVDFYTPDVEKLGRLMSRNLSQWLLDTPTVGPRDKA